MKKLVLHSDQVHDHKEVVLAFIELLGKKSPRLAYIPSQSDLQRRYFNEKVEWYKQFGITDLLYFDVDKEYDEKKIDKLLACDAIFLSGGNTYYFLNSLKKRKFLPKLREYVRTGGILIGVSAGSIMMSKTINITTLHNENTIGLKDYKALGLVDFEFFPHLDHNMKQYLEDLKKYSIKSNSIIYACKDGDGIIVNDDEIKFFGEVLKIKNGEVSRV
ncbi:Type 1 glutamine amidotransferase-like domain-containing protein [bacterium]|nr:Type 1 glutamine amidotransferase-like domain-containing protein [bacterium]